MSTKDKDVDALQAKSLCSDCVGEPYLSDEIRTNGKRSRCHYCNKTRRCFSVGTVAGRVKLAFEQHYSRTSDQPNDWEYFLQRDPESSYEWYRHGEPVVDAIRNAAHLPEQAAEDIQSILADEYSSFDSSAIGEETEFADGSHYEEKHATDEAWQEEWRGFEHSLKTEARFFSRTAVTRLASIFHRIDELRTHDGRPLVVEAGPGAAFPAIWRARVFQSDDKLKSALARPDLHIGSPPALLAMAGRMNARGISVFYGASDQETAIAEVRPPVGSQVATAKFDIIRALRLLDLTTLSHAAETGSIFDPEFGRRMARAKFLGTLSSRITRPVMPDDESFEYLATQAVSDFLATEADAKIDGIIFPSVQVGGRSLNIVLFHKAARVESLDLPKGTEVGASTGRWEEDGWEPEYEVIEEVPPAPQENEKSDDALVLFEDGPDTLVFLGEEDADWRDVSLRIVLHTVTVHRVKGVVFDTEDFAVKRHRWEKRKVPF